MTDPYLATQIEAPLLATWTNLKTPLRVLQPTLR